MSDFPLYLNTVAGGLDRRDQTIGGFSFVVKIYTVPVVEIIGFSSLMAFRSFFSLFSNSRLSF